MAQVIITMAEYEEYNELKKIKRPKLNHEFMRFNDPVSRSVKKYARVNIKQLEEYLKSVGALPQDISGLEVSR